MLVVLFMFAVAVMLTEDDAVVHGVVSTVFDPTAQEHGLARGHEAVDVRGNAFGEMSLKFCF